MPESLKNNDKRIRSCILNDVLEKVPIDKSYENLCKVVGNDAFAFYDFQYWYYRFFSGNQDFDGSSELFQSIKTTILFNVINWKSFEKSYISISELHGENVISEDYHDFIFKKFSRESRNAELHERNIKNHLSNFPKCVKHRILRDVICGIPVEKSYEIFCEIRHFNYPEFEFWYYRFLNGERNLDADVHPPQTTIYDIPLEIIEKIVEYTGLKERTALRKVSTSLRRVSDYCRLHVANLKFDLSPGSSGISFEDVDVLYDWLDEAITDLKLILSNPKHHIDFFDLQLRTLKSRTNFSEFFEFNPKKISATSVKIGVTQVHQFQDYISCFKPKVLKKIELGCYETNGTRYIGDLIMTEQWEQAEEITIHNPVLGSFGSFFHLKRFDIRMSNVWIEALIELRDALSESPMFEWCRIQIKNGPNNWEIQEALELTSVHFDIDMEYFVYNAQNSDDYILYFSFFGDDMFIRKY